MVAYRNFPDIKAEINTLPYSSERLYDLVSILSKEYDKNYFDTLMNECLFSKLDWHKNYKETKNGKETYYSHLIGKA